MGGGVAEHLRCNVRRSRRELVLTPETTHVAAFRVSVRCGKCKVMKPISITQGRYAKVWTTDWATVFERVRFRCRCGSLADGMKIELHTRERPEEVLFVWDRGEYHG